MDRLVFSIFSSRSVTCANLTSKMQKYNIKKQSHDYKYRKEFDSTSIGLWKSLPQRPRPLQYGRGIEKEINIVLKSSIYNHSLLQKGVKQHNNKDLRRRVSKNKLRNTQTIFSLNDLNIWNPDSAGRQDGHISQNNCFQNLNIKIRKFSSQGELEERLLGLERRIEEVI